MNAPILPTEELLVAGGVRAPNSLTSFLLLSVFPLKGDFGLVVVFDATGNNPFGPNMEEPEDDEDCLFLRGVFVAGFVAGLILWPLMDGVETEKFESWSIELLLINSAVGVSNSTLPFGCEDITRSVSHAHLSARATHEVAFFRRDF